MATVVHKAVLALALFAAWPAVGQQATQTEDLDGIEATRDYVAPESSPFADARFEALELRVQALEEALAIVVERLQTEKERRQRLEELLKDAEIIR